MNVPFIEYSDGESRQDINECIYVGFLVESRFLCSVPRLSIIDSYIVEVQ